MIGLMVSSKCGHDKNHIYIVIEETKDFVFLANGITYTKEKLKKKNKKHVQLIKRRYDKSLIERIVNGSQYSNEELKSAIELTRV